jgi:Uma2 family endonuclease
MGGVAPTAPPAVHRLSREEYERMVERGALEGVPVELVDGFLVDVSPQGPRHAAVLQALMRWLADHVALLRIQMPLATDAASEPEPDLALAEHTDPDSHPASALLVVEVAVTSQAQDEHKAGAYARARVPAYWVVDVPARSVVAFGEPGPNGYERRAVLRAEDSLEAPVAVAPITVAELFHRAGL